MTVNTTPTRRQTLLALSAMAVLPISSRASLPIIVKFVKEPTNYRWRPAGSLWERAAVHDPNPRIQSPLL
ncbi:hypothetical protein Varpa_1495 [Variovorax paradoxus EPS]|uniref:Uncharacterized protein n=1 Tax=Variovorax paradoxus (strain EPS) TaxID=595537 RepID=E6V2I6_VARPE|nr:hypothetical protein Varpa_1495 [Variovorax paradoxus EPS]